MTLALPDLDGDVRDGLYAIAEDRGLVYPGASADRDPVFVLAHEILRAYLQAKGPTLAKIAARKLKKENEEA